MFGSPHGTVGCIRFSCYCVNNYALLDYGPLTSEDTQQAFKLSITEIRPRVIIVQVAGINSREEVSKLNGIKVYAQRNALPEPEEDEFYYCDLIGLEVQDPNGNRIGTVRNILNHGAGDIIEWLSTDAGRLLMTPFRESYIPKIEINKGFVVINTTSET